MSALYELLLIVAVNRHLRIPVGISVNAQQTRLLYISCAMRVFSMQSVNVRDFGKNEVE